MDGEQSMGENDLGLMAKKKKKDPSFTSGNSGWALGHSALKSRANGQLFSGCSSLKYF